jgi:hypothetical protein
MHALLMPKSLIRKANICIARHLGFPDVLAVKGKGGRHSLSLELNQRGPCHLSPLQGLKRIDLRDPSLGIW